MSIHGQECLICFSEFMLTLYILIVPQRVRFARMFFGGFVEYCQCFSVHRHAYETIKSLIWRACAKLD